MPKSSTFSNQFLKLITNATGIPGLADNAATAPNSQLFVALHGSDPGIGGNQTTNEIAYTGYARVGVARSTSGFTVTGNSVSPVANIQFPAGTGGSGTVNFWSVGTVATPGTGTILWSGTVSPPIQVGNGVTPILTVQSTIQEQ